MYLSNERLFDYECLLEIWSSSSSIESIIVINPGGH